MSTQNQPKGHPTRSQMLQFLVNVDECLGQDNTSSDRRAVGRTLMSKTNAHVQTTNLVESLIERGQEKPNFGQRLACNMFSIIDGLASGVMACKENNSNIDKTYGDLKVKKPAPNQTEVKMEGAPI